ncbi:hypothetical protein Acr_09g0005140 [Actinidia rufa]|uniref:Hydroxyproline-rich glycoprotein family protein n=1 Tax=Actinidia rufa TaxID=165716 RepID=A0A7J0F5T1_9ERIC|nr:hypothetical protein Acr_09g0005140 [Actinidia rufa]
MAALHHSLVLSLVVLMSFSGIKTSLAARHLLQTMPPIPTLPKATLPPLPTMPTLPQVTLPPPLPKPTLPLLPSSQIPSSLPNIPTLPSIPLPPLPSNFIAYNPNNNAFNSFLLTTSI